MAIVRWASGVGAIALVALGLFVASVDRGQEGRVRAEPLRLGTANASNGVRLSPPIPRANFVLTDSSGQPFAFRERTQGLVTLLYFGYSTCPDVCPVTMAALAEVLDVLEPELAVRVAVVVVSVDEGDEPREVAEWVRAFDRRFYGLSGTREETDRALAFLELPSMGAFGSLQGHTSRILLFTPDDLAHNYFPADTFPAAIAADLAAILATE